MTIEGITYCDLCGSVIFPNDGTTIHIPHKKGNRQFDFHNRDTDDCLSKELTQLKQRFMTAQ